MRTAIAVLFLVSLASAAPPSRKVAITIDDLPAGGGTGCDLPALKQLTARLLAPIRSGRIPVTGFVIGGRCKELGTAGLREVLAMWTEADADLGNHTWSHPDLNATSVADYQADIERGEKALIEAAGRKPRYFRHPMLHAGRDLETKNAIDSFLSKRGYHVAPVTLDNSDWMFAVVYADALKRGDKEMAQRVRDAYVPYLESIFAFFERRAVEVVGREIPQVLLLHANELNACALPEILRMIRGRGYSVITLEEALRDPAYRLPDNYAGPGGFSWVHRWSMTKGMTPEAEPSEPAFISEAYGEMRKR